MNNIEKTLELQKRILDPSSFTTSTTTTTTNTNQKLVVHSAVKQIEKKITIEQALELQKKIVPY
jgi:hypothetical protein